MIAFAMIPNLLYSQPERRHLREGNRLYRADNFVESEIAYRRAAEAGGNLPVTLFNLGSAIYRQQRFDDAVSAWERSISASDDAAKREKGYFNMGNAHLSSGNLIESIEAYKNALRINPSNREAKFNLAFAQDLLEEQKQQQEQQQQQDEGDESGDEDQDRGEDDKDQAGDQPEEGQEQQGDSSDNPGERERERDGEERVMSDEDARRLLEALTANEQRIQEEVLKRRATADRVRSLINW